MNIFNFFKKTKKNNTQENILKEEQPEKYLVVVDMQNDFIDGTLGSEDAQAIVPNVCEKIKNFDGRIILTKDTHFSEDYLKPSSEYKNVSYRIAKKYTESLEGKLLPVLHCMIDKDGNPTDGHNLNDKVEEVAEEKNALIFRKYTFGGLNIMNAIQRPSEIEICGLCTDICVVSNALILRAAFPDVPMKCDSSCCAGTTPENHEAALKVMRSCQIEII